MNKKKSFVYVFEGDGKGKTSAALGVATRMLLIGKNVAWISWFKTKEWNISESKLPEVFGNKVAMFMAGEGFFIGNGELELVGGVTIKKAKTTSSSVVYDKASVSDHHEAAKKALILASALLATKEYDILILDEIIKAVNDGLISELEVINLLEDRGSTHIVLTGHKCTKLIARNSDLITKMKKIKHPYDKGILAIRGLDY